MRSNLYILLIVFAVGLTMLEARGGRGRGGLGGLFSGWRKGGKSSSKGSGGRVIWGGSTTHNSQTKSKSNFSPKTKIADPQTKKYGLVSHSYLNPTGAHSYSNAQLPPRSTYHTNPAQVPAGALYYPHTPPYSSSSDFSNFFTGYMTGRVLSSFHNHHVHVYQQQATEQDGRTVIIINNGTTVDNNKVHPAKIYWPTDTLVPLTPFNTSYTSEESQTPTKEPFFKRPPASDQDKTSAIPPTDMPESEKNADIPPPPTTGGIICMPMMFNETDANDQSKLVQVEKIVCFPAPPLPTAPVIEHKDGMICMPRIFIEADPNDSSKTVEVQKQHCSPARTERIDPVVGDITTDEFKEAS